MIPDQLTSRILKTELIYWKDLQFIQQEDFKELPVEAFERLKKSILNNNFTQPFYIWECPSDKVKYCLDGKHRVLVLESLVKENFHVPDLLPATFVDCENKTEAAKLVLLYSSSYAQITESGFMNFLEMYELNPEDIKMEVSIPGISDVVNMPFPDQLTDDPKNKPAVMKITFATAAELERLKEGIENYLKENAEVSYILSVSAGEI